MAALVRHLRRGIGVFNSPRSLLTSPLPRSFLSRLLSPSPHPPPIRPTRLSNFQAINARFSLPVKQALSRPFAPSRLPRPPVVPANVSHLGLGTARAFHSGRPIFQNMIDNVPIATRALWEAEWDVKSRKKQARRLRRPAHKFNAVPKSREMLKPIVEQPQSHHPSELDIYFPVGPAPTLTTYLLVPLAPTPTARLPLAARSDRGSAHLPLLPISDLAYIHASHRLHSLRVSTLFARLDAANVWDDPGVNVDAYAFGPHNDENEKQCTVLRVTFNGWNVARVRAILGDTAEEWYSLQETRSDPHPTLAPLPGWQHRSHSPVDSRSPSLTSDKAVSCCVSNLGIGDKSDASSPIQATASAQHGFVFPTLNFSSAFSDTTASDIFARHLRVDTQS